MAVEVVLDGLGPSEWSAMGRGFLDYNLYQSWAYGDSSAESTASRVHRLVAYRDGQAIGMCQARVKRIPLVGGGLAQVYWGPVWRSAPADAQDLHHVLVAIRTELAGRLGLNVRLISHIWDGRFGEDVMPAYRDAGFRPASGAPAERTVCIDLAAPLGQLRGGLHQKWRNCLNHAERNGLEVRTGAGAEFMDAFVRLYDKMWGAKRFATGVDVRQIRALQDELPTDEKLVIQLAMADGEPVAGHVAAMYGDTCVYLLGASSESGRALKASYLLQWKTIELAKDRGTRWYDLGGVDKEKNPGVYHFKSGMGGREAAYLAPMVAHGRARSRHFVSLAERAYRLFRRRRHGGDYAMRRIEKSLGKGAVDSHQGTARIS